MAKFTFNLPDIGEGIAEAEIVAWHVKVGDMITEDQPLADMMTDKATVEMESPVSGVVTKVAGEAGDVIAIGSMLVEIETASDVSDVSHATPTTTEEPVLAATIADEEPSAPQPVVTHEVAKAEIPKVQESPAIQTHATITASPAVRARARDLGVDLTDVKTAGGHVRHADLDSFLSYGSGQGYRS